jgi:hypothetical protein
VHLAAESTRHIIAGSKEDHPERALEQFWLELAEGSNANLNSPFLEWLTGYPIDFNKLQPTGKPNARLIITAVNVLTAEPLIFDSAKQQITPKHILAATGYPTYYFRWIEVELN